MLRRQANGVDVGGQDLSVALPVAAPSGTCRTEQQGTEQEGFATPQSKQRPTQVSTQPTPSTTPRTNTKSRASSTAITQGHTRCASHVRITRHLDLRNPLHRDAYALQGRGIDGAHVERAQLQTQPVDPLDAREHDRPPANSNRALPPATDDEGGVGATGDDVAHGGGAGRRAAAGVGCATGEGGRCTGPGGHDEGDGLRVTTRAAAPSSSPLGGEWLHAPVGPVTHGRTSGGHDGAVVPPPARLCRRAKKHMQQGMTAQPLRQPPTERGIVDHRQEADPPPTPRPWLHPGRPPCGPAAHAAPTPGATANPTARSAASQTSRHAATGTHEVGGRHAREQSPHPRPRRPPYVAPRPASRARRARAVRARGACLVRSLCLFDPPPRSSTEGGSATPPRAAAAGARRRPRPPRPPRVVSAGREHCC